MRQFVRDFLKAFKEIGFIVLAGFLMFLILAAATHNFWVPR